MAPLHDTMMSDDKRRDLVIACARLLYTNGQGTEQVVAAADRLARALALRATVSLRWGELELEEDHRPVSRIAANPAGVDMTRVIAGMRVIDDVEAGRLAPEAALTEIAAISRSPASPTWFLALASGAAAVAMAVIFGLAQVVDASMIFVSAFAGAFLRREVARPGANPLVQPFCASLLAGVIAAIAFRLHLVTSLRLVALCPCVILVPGAHVLNGVADLINGRLHLGVTRMIHAVLIITALATGLLVGLVICDASLPLLETTRVVPLWQHMLAGGVAAAAFGVMFSMPLRQLPLPVLVGALAQATRWGALAAGSRVGAAALIASLALGMILMPLARRRRMPFAAVGFIAVVSMIPGSYLFTMAAGLMQIAMGDTTLDVIGVTLANATNATLIVLAISLGLAVPKLLLDCLDERSRAGSASPSAR
jgi:uncharacterized membrane protein YjjP (DUF1212 family)